ncbi:MAG: DNA-3-methyladenine glycosylase 2 family protein [Candidatus Synoicihabitans palmerolidicus]|nr:DNA-3-methyladenine glycosylase 2 family protein [Candidatus Synoicihabitans palmerolidicus]
MNPRYDSAAALLHLRDADPRLGELIDDCGPFSLQLHRSGDLFASLLQAIIYQQLHGRTAAKIHGRVLALIDSVPQPSTVDALDDNALRTAGLSRAKLSALRDLSAHAQQGKVPSLVQARRMSDEALVKNLSSVKGIGPWSVQMLLLFRLGRPDVMPAGDFAIRLAFSRHFLAGSPVTQNQLLDHAARWRPWRSVAAWYLWRSLAPDGGQ